MKKILTAEEAHGGHHTATAAHEVPAHEAIAETHVMGEEESFRKDGTIVSDTAKAIAADKKIDSLHTVTSTAAVDAHSAPQNHDTTASTEHKSSEAHDAHAEHENHLKHVLTQLQNKPWAALYVCLYFLLVDFYGSFSFLCDTTSSTSRLVSSIV